MIRTILLASLAASLAAAEGPEPEFSELDARELHNLGTRRLGAGDLPGAEDALRASLGRDRDALRTGSLHNLGHVRFGKGRAALGGGTEGEVTDLSLARSWIEAADADISDMTDMIEVLDKAQAEGSKPDYVPAVAALSSGIGTHRAIRKEGFPAAEKALARRGGVIAAWTRSVGDFRGAAELDPPDRASAENADRVEALLRALARETDLLRETLAALRRKHEELREVILELLKRIPPEERPQSGEGEGEDDEFGERKPQQGGGGDASEDGEEGKMSEQEARSQLEALRDEFGRRMPAAGQGKPGEARPRDRKGKDY
jgi:hypothetical protein